MSQVKTASATIHKDDIENLFQACHSGDIGALKNLFSKYGNGKQLKGFLNHVRAGDGWTPLMVATAANQQAVIEWLLSISTSATKDMHRQYLNIHHIGASGSTASDLAPSEHIKNLLNNEYERRKRLLEGTVKIGFHETAKDAFDFILRDIENERFPMVGGVGGYFGGGVYFAANENESSIKSLHKGRGLECRLWMGNMYIIKTKEERNEFINTICDMESPYEFPIDVMQKLLLEFGYDSVWGVQDTTVFPEQNRILRTGDEYVVYSADQVQPIKGYAIMHHNISKFEKESKPIWTNIPLRLDYDDPIKPTKPASYYVLNSEEAHVFHFPTFEEIKSAFPNQTFQNGDIVNFSHPDYEFTETIVLCIYHETKTYREWMFYQSVMGDDLMNFWINDSINRVFLPQAKFMPLLGFTSGIEFYMHYRNVFTKSMEKSHIKNQIKQYRFFVELVNFKRESLSLLDVIHLSLKEDSEKESAKWLTSVYKKIPMEIRNLLNLTPSNISILISRLSQFCGIYTDGAHLFLMVSFNEIFNEHNQLYEIKKGLLSMFKTDSLENQLEKLIGKSGLGLFKEWNALNDIVKALKTFIENTFQESYKIEVLNGLNSFNA